MHRVEEDKVDLRILGWLNIQGRVAGSRMRRPKPELSENANFSDSYAAF